MTALSANDVARQVCAMGDWEVTNLALQKMLYMLEMVYMGNHNGERLLQNDFEAWDLGPVIPEIYHRTKMFGSEPIRSDVFYSARKITDPNQIRVLEDNVPWLLTKSPSQLVRITHWKDGAWAKNYNQSRRNARIPPLDILQEFRDRQRLAQRRAEPAVV